MGIALAVSARVEVVHISGLALFMSSSNSSARPTRYILKRSQNEQLISCDSPDFCVLKRVSPALKVSQAKERNCDLLVYAHSFQSFLAIQRVGFPSKLCVACLSTSSS
jgi:hypothetical protein